MPCISLELLTFRLVCAKRLASLQCLQFQIFLPWHSFPERFLFMGFCSNKLKFSYPPVYSIWGQQQLTPGDYISLMDLNRVCSIPDLFIFYFFKMRKTQLPMYQEGIYLGWQPSLQQNLPRHAPGSHFFILAHNHSTSGGLQTAPPPKGI